VNQSTSIPLLENMFIELSLIHDITAVCRAVCDAVRSDTDVSHVLRRCASDKLHSQMEELTTIIEQLGGQTDLSNDSNDNQETELETSHEQE
jgi:hypothetical protein